MKLTSDSTSALSLRALQIGGVSSAHHKLDFLYCLTLIAIDQTKQRHYGTHPCLTATRQFQCARSSNSRATCNLQFRWLPYHTQHPLPHYHLNPPLRKSPHALLLLLIRPSNDQILHRRELLPRRRFLLPHIRRQNPLFLRRRRLLPHNRRANKTKTPCHQQNRTLPPRTISSVP